MGAVRPARSEANKRVPLDSAVINSYTGDGQLLAKFLCKDTFTFHTTDLRMLVVSNRPNVTLAEGGDEDALMVSRRFLAWSKTMLACEVKTRR
jgi:hypothetical protein